MAKTSDLSLHTAADWETVYKTDLNTTAGTANIGIVHVDTGSEYGELISYNRIFDKVSFKVTVPAGANPLLEESADHDFEISINVPDGPVDAWLDIDMGPGPDDQPTHPTLSMNVRGVVVDGTVHYMVRETIPYDYTNHTHDYIKIEQINLGSHNVIGFFGSPNGKVWTPLYDHTAITEDCTITDCTVEMVDWGFVEHFNEKFGSRLKVLFP